MHASTPISEEYHPLSMHTVSHTAIIRFPSSNPWLPTCDVVRCPHFIRVASEARVKWLHDATGRADRVRNAAWSFNATTHCLPVNLPFFFYLFDTFATNFDDATLRSELTSEDSQ